jgi:hypothetical protein
MQKKNPKTGDIKVKRFDGCDAHRLQIEPADGSWVLWVDAEGKPSLWIAVDAPADDMSEDERAQFPAGRTVVENGVEVPTIKGYMPASLLYQIEPETMAAHEREAIAACDEAPSA